MREILTGIKAMETDFDRLFDKYVECMMHETDEDMVPLNRNFTVTDISAECLGKMKRDCEKFYRVVRRKFDLLGKEWGDAGMDFWLTRNRDGAGFWDGDWAEPFASYATNLAHRFGECSVYVGDDGWIECMG